MKKFLKYFSLGLISTLLSAAPSFGAERISFFYAPFGEFSLSTKSLETFAKEGKITSDLELYARRATPEQLAQLRQLLQQRFNVTPTLVSQFTYSPIGEQVVRRLGELLLTEAHQNGFYALRGALIIAANDPQGLTVVNIIRRFPSATIRLNFTEGVKIVNNLSELLKDRDAVVAYLRQQALLGTITTANIDFSQKPDLRQPGKFSFEKVYFELNDVKRSRRLPVDVYIPQAKTQGSNNQPASPFPLIVISHGLASDRYALAYLAQHLASYGFAVAALDHPGSNSQRFQQYFAGLAGPPEPREFIDRPLDVKYVLDELQRLATVNASLKGKINFQQVGAIGHSFGGYTVLTLAGAKLNFAQLRRDCYPNRSLNLSLLLQCQASELAPKDYSLQDSRIKAVMAINPINSSVLGQSGLSQIKVPAMLVTGSQDIFAPAIPEQIRPFTWLTDTNKYLLLIQNATHFTALEESTPSGNVLPVPSGLLGPEPTVAYSYLKAFSVAFLESNLLNNPEYQVYLQPAYAQYVSQNPLNLSLLTSLTTEQFTQALKNDPKQK
ncbi:alpha/beta hydrolase [Nostoc sp. FACHB-152]|uniref:alpha/beta hydrolase n=1 Tax=unclassified Nostoc TaxID=2593658 RepID=UPI0016895619|nr:MULTISPECIES: alpha/beta hydrolase [unclassified Nostoc]MBD2450031.1 alpha/beta hydrolase [Nostoc sp. FACHB-152]MBD2470151.1 alpha/beta hydrolase [Nostoc sp. FACHB-145]